MKRSTGIILLILFAGFLFGLVRLFHLRFEAGDVYPEYSSLRSDPLGAKALHASLEKLVGVERNYRPLVKLGSYNNATVLFLGVRASELECEPAEFKAVESFVRDGGRLVITLLPSYSPFNPALAPSRTARPRQDPDAPLLISLAREWDFTLGYTPVLRDTKGVYQPGKASLRDEWSGHGLPEKLDVHTSLFFTNATEDWKVLYEWTSDRAVVMQRALGSGTIVLAADSYYFSNEALLKERASGLLSWFIGPNRKVVFDETHLGVSESPGVATLARKYHLHGVAAGLLLLAALFVWKNNSSLIPRGRAEENPGAPEVVFGRDSAGGFLNLLRRNIRKRDLLGVCLTEWRQSCAHRVSRGKLEEMQRVIDEDNAREQQNPLTVYRAISRILTRRL